MTPTERLIEKLEDELGYRVTLFKPAKGYWVKQDVHRWEAWAIDLDTFDAVELVSWDTITDCARKKITKAKSSYPHQVEIFVETTNS